MIVYNLWLYSTSRMMQVYIVFRNTSILKTIYFGEYNNYSEIGVKMFECENI